MEERLRLINQHNAWIAGYDFADYTGKRFYAIALAIYQCSRSMKPYGSFVYTAFDFREWWGRLGHSNSQVSKIRRINYEVLTERVK